MDRKTADSRHPVVSEGNTPETKFDIMHYFGWRELKGIAIQIDPTYMAPLDVHWTKALFKIILVIVLVPGIFVTYSMIKLKSMLANEDRNCRPTLASNIASQFFGFVLVHKLLGPKKQEPVRDIRIRDTEEVEHLIRVQGELVSGNINVGDDLVVEGFLRSGTLHFRRGVNKRTRAAILVRHL